MGELAEMNASQATAMLRQKRERYGHDRMRVEIHQGVPGLLFKEVDGRTASVATPGSGWVSLELNDGFSREHFEDEISDDDLSNVVDVFIRLGMHYLDHGGVILPSVIRGFERMAIELPGNEVVLSRSLGRSLKLLFNGHR